METKNFFLSLLNENRPDAVAVLHGNAEHPDINGIVQFYSLPESGILIAAEITGLPENESDSPAFFAFHIHENGDCSGSFENTGSHYNPDNVPHPEHAGDLPPLLSNDGYVWMIFYNGYLTIPMLLNRSLIIHRDSDDFTTQPSGNAGEKIACGVIRETKAFIQS
ncbi:MAG: superoxide dismutase family protein [Lachnospiraceae bacterium]|nr:superoxide dismutase family protein [Lachnospiraceae bacterium]